MTQAAIHELTEHELNTEAQEKDSKSPRIHK
jgi:hypothetical protein